MRYHHVLTLVFLFSILASCQNEEAGKAIPPGTWYSEGYAQTLIIGETQYQFLDQYDRLCLERHSGNLQELLPFLHLANDTLKLSKGTSVYTFTPREEGFADCTPDAQTDTLDVFLNYTLFAKTVRDRFAFRDKMNFSPDSVIDHAEEELALQPTPYQLFKSMETVMNTLNDNHGYLSAPDMDTTDVNEHDKEEEENERITYGDFQVADRIADMYLDEEYSRGTKLIRWGIINDSLGYMQVKAMWLFADLEPEPSAIENNGYVGAYVDKMESFFEGTYIEKEREAVARLLDTIMTDLYPTKSIIIDVRCNGGGQDIVSMEILKAFNDKKRAVAQKKAITANGKYTDEQTLYLPEEIKAYTKPVYLLTSRQTASAADFIALATLELPHIQRIGTPTQGALSDAFERKLPNGWQFSISNERYTDMQGNNYEYIGVPPDFAMDYPEERQVFFKYMMQYTLLDKLNVLQAITTLSAKK